MRPSGAGKHTQIHLGKSDLARIFAGDADVGGHGDLKSTTHAMPIEGRNHQLGRVLKPKQHLVGVQAEVILEGGINAGQHLDVRARREELVTRSREQDHVDIVIHASRQDGVVQLPVHLVSIGIGGRVRHLNDADAAVLAVVDQLFG